MTIALDANTGISVANASGTANLSSTVLTVGNSTVNSTCHAYNGSSLAMCDAMAAHNIVVNGEMRVSQQNGNTQSNTINWFATDQWNVSWSGTVVANTYQSTDAPPGYNYSYLTSITTTDVSPGASDYLSINQNIEGYRIARLSWGTAGAVNATLGFWAKCSITGTFSVALRNAAQTFTWLGVITISNANTWTWTTVTIPAQTSGVWPTVNLQGCVLYITLMSGSTGLGALGWNSGSFAGVSGMTNLSATGAATFQVTGVILLAGDYTIASAQAKFVQRHWDDELRICQRYWMKTYPYADSPGKVYSNPAGGGPMAVFAQATQSFHFVMWQFPVQMRITPATTPYSPYTGTSAKGRVQNAAVDVAAISFGGCENQIGLEVNNVSVTAGDVVWFHAIATARM